MAAEAFFRPYPVGAAAEVGVAAATIASLTTPGSFADTGWGSHLLSYPLRCYL